MLAWGGHLLAPDGRWLALKGRLPQDELAALPEEFRVEDVVALRVPGLDAERHLVVIRRRDSDECNCFRRMDAGAPRAARSRRRRDSDPFRQLESTVPAAARSIAPTSARSRGLASDA